MELRNILGLREHFYEWVKKTSAPSASISQSEMLAYVDSYVGEDLDRCVERVIEIDKDPNKYAAMLSAKVFLREPGLAKSEFTGYNVSEGIASLLEAQGSTLFRNPG